MNEIAKLSSRVWHPKAVKNEVVQPTMVVPNLRELRPETPAEAEAFARQAQAFSEATSAGRRVSPFASTAPKPPIVGEQLSNDSIRAQVASLSDVIAQIRPGQLEPLNLESIAPLSGFNQLVHDRIAAVPQNARRQILTSGIPQQKTLFLQRPLSSTGPAHDGAPQNKLQLEEIFHAVQSLDGTATTLGRTFINNEWYHFGTNSGTSPLQQASTWIAPTRLLTSQNPALQKDLSADRVLRDVQGLFKGPWNPYLKGAGLLNKPHTVDIRHADKDGIKSVVATLNTITGTLETIQSVTKGIQQGLELIGMLGSLGDLGKYMQIFNQMKLPGTPGELITSLITGKGINPNKPPAPPTADQTGSGKNGVLVTKGGAAAKAMGDGLLAKAEAEKKKAEEEAAKREAAKKKAEEEAARKKAEEEAEKKKAEDEAAKTEAAKKRTEEQAAEKNDEKVSRTPVPQPVPTPTKTPIASADIEPTPVVPKTSNAETELDSKAGIKSGAGISVGKDGLEVEAGGAATFETEIQKSESESGPFTTGNSTTLKGEVGVDVNGKKLEVAAEKKVYVGNPIGDELYCKAEGSVDSTADTKADLGCGIKGALSPNEKIGVYAGKSTDKDYGISEETKCEIDSQGDKNCEVMLKLSTPIGKLELSFEHKFAKASSSIQECDPSNMPEIAAVREKLNSPEGLNKSELDFLREEHSRLTEATKNEACP